MKFALLILTILMGAASVAGQGKEITSAEYFEAFAPAIQKILETPHRRTRKVETYKAGKLASVNEELEERNAKDYFRFLSTERIGVRLTTDEYREIKGVYYCRRNGGKWIKSKSDCSTAKRFGTSSDAEATETFSFEPLTDAGKILRLYTHATTYSGKADAAANGSTVRSTENKVWLNEVGTIFKREYRQVFNGTKNYSVLVELYEYDAKFSTAPPIK